MNARISAHENPARKRRTATVLPSSNPRDIDATVAALSGLRAPDRAAVMLIYFHGCTQAEVAVQLGMPPAEVRRRVARGMLDLGDRLCEPDGMVRVGRSR